MVPGIGLSNLLGTRKMARPAGFEPATLGLEVRCSIQLSYGRPLWNLTRFPNNRTDSREAATPVISFQGTAWD
jgi:hypothetical protein